MKFFYIFLVSVFIVGCGSDCDVKEEEPIPIFDIPEGNPVSLFGDGFKYESEAVGKTIKYYRFVKETPNLVIIKQITEIVDTDIQSQVLIQIPKDKISHIKVNMPQS